MGGGGEQVNLRIAARHADATNWQVGLEAFVRKSALLARYCEEIGRPFDAVTRTHGPDCRLFDTEAEARAWCPSPTAGNLWGGESDRHLSGRQPGGDAGAGDGEDPGLHRRRLQRIHPVAPGLPGDETLRRFMAEVVPKLRSSE